MIRVDESEPVGEVDLSFPYRDVQIQRGIDPKEWYDLETEIGRGKFGTVFRCTEKNTGLALAAKFVAVPKKEDRRNVEREVEIMRCLQHPRLIQLYDAFENGKVMCVVLELILGGELFERVIDDDFVLTEKSCTVFMRQICEGIEFIHKQNILHLDMKPENILCLTKTGNRIKIIDFGLARKFDPAKKLQVLFGTPEFVAPEVVNFDQISFGTDMWSVGVICYVLLSGLSPFMGENDVVTMANVTIAKYDFDDEAFKEISDTAKDFIAKLLVKNQKERMTAEDCLLHPWLRRRSTQKHRPSMDVTKDNLRQFVERWSEHPNSPYVFELPSHSISPCAPGIQLSDSLPSLAGMSPSPCGSLTSSTGSDDMAFMEQPSHTINHLTPSNNTIIDISRRASDSSCIVHGSDVSERVNLAEEIRKLSDKLYQLSVMPDLTNETTTMTMTKSITTPKPKKSEAINIKTNSRVVTAEHDYAGVVPWRRTKFRVTELSRDVPVSPKMNGAVGKLENTQRKAFTYKSTTSFSENCGSAATASGTKDLLLRLLEQWDGPQSSKRQSQRSGSVAADWCENESLGQKTISSLNTFFQSRSTSKKTHPFLKPNGFK